MDVFFFPECVARVPVSLWGSGGWGCVRSTLRLRSQPFATVRNRPQPFATVRNRPRDPCMAMPMVSSAKGVTCGGFTCGVASFRVAGVALRDIQTCLVTCRKSFCVAGAILLQRFQTMRCSFHGRRSTLDVSIVILRGRRSTRRVVLRVFCKSHCQGCVKVATRCTFRGKRGILWDVMKTDGSLARNIDFEVANFQVLRRTRRKTPILKLQSVKIGGSQAQNARFDAPTCLVSSLWLSCGLAVSMGEAAKPVLFEGFQAGCHVVLRGRSRTLWHSNLITCRKPFCVAGAILLRRLRRKIPVALVVAGAAFWRSLSSFCVAGAALQTWRVVLRAPHSTLYTSHFAPLRTLHSTPHTTLHTPHFTQCTLHTLHSTLLALHFALHHALRFTHSTLYTPHLALHNSYFTLHTPHSTLHFPLHTPRSTLYTPHSTLYTLHFTLGTDF